MRYLFVVVILSIFIISGCETMSKDSSSPQALESQTVLRFSDIPVPAGFKALPQDSYTFEASGVRVGVLKYQGKADPGQVINFYREQMPMFNWNLLNVVEYGDRLINFDRDNETCVITMLSRGNNITLTITLGPKPQQSSKKATRPIK